MRCVAERGNGDKPREAGANCDSKHGRTTPPTEPLRTENSRPELQHPTLERTPPLESDGRPTAPRSEREPLMQHRYAATVTGPNAARRETGNTLATEVDPSGRPRDARRAHGRTERSRSGLGTPVSEWPCRQCWASVLDATRPERELSHGVRTPPAASKPVAAVFACNPLVLHLASSSACGLSFSEGGAPRCADARDRRRAVTHSVSE